MFKVTGGKGVNIKFENGYAVSIQWGFGNYCANKEAFEYGSDDYTTKQRELGELGSHDAECAVFNLEGELMADVPDWHDSVNGWMSPDDVLKLMNWVAEL